MHVHVCISFYCYQLMCVCVYSSTDYDKVYEAKLAKTLKKFTPKPITQVHVHAVQRKGLYSAHVHTCMSIVDYAYFIYIHVGKAS